jgi:hypothetical protein
VLGSGLARHRTDDVYVEVLVLFAAATGSQPGCGRQRRLYSAGYRITQRGTNGVEVPIANILAVAGCHGRLRSPPERVPTSITTGPSREGRLLLPDRGPIDMYIAIRTSQALEANIYMHTS